MENKNVLLVPTDFSKVADSAISHAATVAGLIGGELCLFHVIGKEKERTEAEAKLKAMAESTSASTGIKCKTLVYPGSIFDEIGKAAEHVGATLIFMGTHGVKGTQHLFGSYALKVITNSNTPFIVVHQRAIRHGYKKIVVPIDLSKENKQIMNAIKDIVDYFKSSVHLLVKEEKDEFFARQVVNNVNYARNFLSQNGVTFTIEQAEKGKSFAKEVIKFASKMDADLIATINLKEHSVDLLGGSFEQDVIANDAQIPVMIMNHLDVMKDGEFKGFFR